MRHFFHDPGLDVPSPTYLLHFVYQTEAGPAIEAPAVSLDPETPPAARQPSEETKQEETQKKEEKKGGVPSEPHFFKAGRFGQLGPDVQVLSQSF